MAVTTNPEENEVDGINGQAWRHRSSGLAANGLSPSSNSIKQQLFQVASRDQVCQQGPRRYRAAEDLSRAWQIASVLAQP